MTWQRRPYVPPSRFQGGGYLTRWAVRLERNHDAANILVIDLGFWTYTKSFKKRAAGSRLSEGEVLHG